jgi:DNA primase
MFTKFVEYAVNILFEEYTEGNPKILKFLKERNLQIKDIDKYNIGYIRENNPIPKFVSDDLEYYKEIQIVQDDRITVSDRIIIPVKDIDGEFCMISCRDAREYGSKTAKKSNQKYLTIKDKGVN